MSIKLRYESLETRALFNTLLYTFKTVLQYIERKKKKKEMKQT